MVIITDGIIDKILRSVYTDRITDGIFRISKKKWFADVEIFVGDFTDGITEEFKP
jgi:hypothetical protein